MAHLKKSKPLRPKIVNSVYSFQILILRNCRDKYLPAVYKYYSKYLAFFLNFPSQKTPGFRESLCSLHLLQSLSLSLPPHGHALLFCFGLRPTSPRPQITPPQTPPNLQVCHPRLSKTAASISHSWSSKLGKVALSNLMALGFSSIQTSHLRPSCPSYFSLFRSCPRSSRSLWTRPR